MNAKHSRKGKKNPFWGKKHTEETKQKISKAHKGKKLSEETKRKMRLSRVGKKPALGCKVSDETKAKISKALIGEKNPMWGKHHSEEIRKKISESRQGTNNPNWKGGTLLRDGRKYVLQKNHPNACMWGYLQESRLNAEKVLGRYLKSSEVVHHINGNILDNRNENLLICTNSYHTWLHNKIRSTRA